MPRDKVFLVIIRKTTANQRYIHDSLEEMTELSLSARGAVVGHSFVNLPNPSPSHFIRQGKIEEIRSQVILQQADVIIFNADLSPVQSRNLEQALGTRIVDRTGLILDIFARRAQSREGKLQVELAQLNYLLPRLVGQGVIMSRLGGGIGTRGPGEQKLEVDRRKIRERIVRLKQDLKKLHKHRALLRDGRKQKKFYQVVIVGYTNAGKTTLLNALTGSHAYVENKLFATLDPKTRVQTLNGRRDILFTDTVGFIQDLPHGLIEAFHATLEEATDADLILHVADASSEYLELHLKVVTKVLKQLEADAKPTLFVFNKCDKLTEPEMERLKRKYTQAIFISAKRSEGLDELLAQIMALAPAQE